MNKLILLTLLVGFSSASLADTVTIKVETDDAVITIETNINVTIKITKEEAE